MQARAQLAALGGQPWAQETPHAEQERSSMAPPWPDAGHAFTVPIGTEARLGSAVISSVAGDHDL